MGEHEDAENLRRSRAMVEGARPVRYWLQRPTLEQLALRVAQLDQRVAEVERLLADELGDR